MNFDATAFDALATDYDQQFTHSQLGRMLRARVWEKLDYYFEPDQHILELACGTGEDALWLARHGVQVTATDGSAKMVQAARTKSEQADLKISIHQISLQNMIKGDLIGLGLFDGVLSNFGGLNTIRAWQDLAQSLYKITHPGSKLILVPMGPFCPWEIVWYLGHGQLKTAFRRLRRNGATAKIGANRIPIWYPSAARLRSEFAPWFHHLETEALGIWLPPTYLDHFVHRWPRLFTRLNQFDRWIAPYLKGWGDHYIAVFERR